MNFTTKLQKNLIGVVLCAVLGLCAWFLGDKFPIIGGPIFAILIGIAITTISPNLVTKKFGNDLSLQSGVKFTSKKILQYSIILLGFKMQISKILEVGGSTLIIMVFTLTSAFLTAYIMGKILKTPSNMTTLIGVGTSICGGSAIAATAPVIEATDEEIAHSISTIFLFNILAVFIFPYLGKLLHMDDFTFGVWAGTAINDTSSVVAASAHWSELAGNTIALETATIVKLTRTLMIVPISLFLAIRTSKRKNREDSNFNLKDVFPWFVIYFVIVAIFNSFVAIPTGIQTFLIDLGQFMIIMAMVAIGLNTDLKKLIHNGFKPIFLGLCCWFVLSVVALVTINIIL